MAVSITGVSGLWTHGATLIASGAGFDPKSVAAPRVWDPCTGSDPLTLWDGFWPTEDANFNVDYRTAQRSIPMPHSRTTQYLCGCHYDDVSAEAGYAVMFWKNRTMTLPSFTYASWYQRFDDNWTFGLGSPADDNLKTWDYSKGSEPYNPENWYTEYHDPKPTSSSSSCQWHINDDNSSITGGEAWGGAAVNPMSGVWAKQEMFIRYSTTSGRVVTYENGVLKFNYSGPTDLMTGTARSESIGGYARSQGSTNNWRYFADAYLDDTWQVIQLGNAATAGACTLFENQIPTAWADSSITFTANLGALGNTDTAFLYVTNASGSTNTVGYEVSLGSETQPTQTPTTSDFAFSSSGGGGVVSRARKQRRRIAVRGAARRAGGWPGPVANVYRRGR